MLSYNNTYSLVKYIKGNSKIVKLQMLQQKGKHFIIKNINIL